MNQNKVDVFRQTIDVYSNNPYVVDTEELRENGTQVYDCLVGAIKFNPRDMHIEVVNGDTVETGRKFVCKDSSKTTAILNFADALTPGGLVWQGASTQEEHICRCSNLYASLTTKEADELYYQYNAKSVHRLKQHIYTDSIIYSKDVLFFRSGNNYSILKSPYKMDVITCPAPSAKLTDSDAEMIMFNRILGIVQLAIVNNVDNLILGAWGCGAFGQNPKVVAKCFKNVLVQYPAFDNVIFAIRNCGADYKLKTTSNYAVFKEILM